MLGAFYFHGQQLSQDLQTPRDLHHVGYIGADSCRRCHEDHYNSWSRTFHITMTQDVNQTPPRADFGNHEAYEYGGIVTEFALSDAGMPTMNFDGWDYHGQSSFEISPT